MAFDVNSDGLDDVVIGGEIEYVYLTVDGGFAAVETRLTPSDFQSQSEWRTLLDVDHDGHADVLDSEGAHLWENRAP